MRWFSLLASSLLCAGGLAAKKEPTDTFQAFQSKQLSSTPIKIDDSAYSKLVGSTPRDYSSAILLTAMDARYGCQLCREFQPEFDLLARSWTKGDKAGESRVVFATLDFNDGRDTFMSLGLQTAPVLLFFPPTAGPHAVGSPEPLRYDFTNGPGPAEVVHHWISRQLLNRPHPPVKRPINWIAWITSITILLGSATVLFVAWPYVLPVIQNRNIWAAISLISILLFTSGHMFNHIRKVPYVAGDGRGGISYFAGGFQNQFGMETQIVAAMYGILSFAAISLAVKVPRIADEKVQQVAALVWGAVIFFMYSFLLSVFRMKNGGYPFSLPPFM
ncbi:oligosaccharyl transferase subunit ost3/OST6 [Sporothrix eucalyptigena]|uniref:Oligosaccharyl transferase subunit ost3/OST6 n=1 Tax=Sporothrix eucalyptigena TaxID=1812306 RepID=A0ABP0ANW1_9PEZI